MKIGIVTILLCLALGLTALLGSCKTDTLQFDSETITTLKVVALNTTTNVADTFEYVNFNETKPNPPSYVDTIRLRSESSYLIQVILLNETPNPLQVMTDTILARANNHLMVYNVDPSPGLFSVKVLDKDSKGLPLGLSCSWATSGPTGGWLRMILRQQPGDKNGTETPGTTDFEADFPVVVN